MKQNLLIDSDLNFVNRDYELLKALRLINKEKVEIIDGYDKIKADKDNDYNNNDEFKTDNKKDNDQNNYQDSSKIYIRQDYLIHFREDV